MKITIEPEEGENSKTALKIEAVIQRILNILKDPEKFKIVWPKLKNFTDSVESGKTLEETTKIPQSIGFYGVPQKERMPCFGMGLGLHRIPTSKTE